MTRLLGLVAVAIFAAGAFGQDAATRLSKEELLALLPGTKVTHVAPSTGSTRHWTNEPDGKFVASSDAKGYLGNATGGIRATARGTWSVNDDGKYCVEIDWRGVKTEKWCSSILKTPDGVYYLGTVADKSKIEFAR